MLRFTVALCAFVFVAACGADNTFAPEEKVQAARYVAGGPPSITLYTTINDKNGTGAHSALLINSTERVLFDPAGTWTHPKAPVQNDVHYGMTDKIVNFYLDYQARDSASEKFHVIEHELEVSPAVAAQIMRAAKAYGAVPKAQCANSISTILSDIPGFESIKKTWFPRKLGASFGALPGVRERIVTEENDNPGEGHGVIMVDDRGNPV